MLRLSREQLSDGSMDRDRLQGEDIRLPEQAECINRWFTAVSAAIRNAHLQEVKSAAPLLDKALDCPGPLTRDAAENLKATAKRAVKASSPEKRDKTLDLLGKKTRYVLTMLQARVSSGQEVHNG